MKSLENFVLTNKKNLKELNLSKTKSNFWVANRSHERIFTKRYGITPNNVCDLFTLDEEKACSNKAYHNAKKIISEIDKRLSKEMNIVLGLKDLNYFDIFYTYKLSKDLASLNNLRLIQKKISKKTSGKVSFSGSFNTKFLSFIFDEKGIIVKNNEKGKKNIFKRVKEIFKKIKVSSLYKERSYLRLNSIVFLKGFYDTEFFYRKIKCDKYKVKNKTFYTNLIIILKIIKLKSLLKKEIINYLKEKNFLAVALLQHLNDNCFNAFYEPLKILRNFKTKTCIWGNAPGAQKGFKFSNCLIPYIFLYKNQRVVGCQHGSSIFDTYKRFPEQNYHADFKYCSEYITYNSKINTNLRKYHKVSFKTLGSIRLFNLRKKIAESKLINKYDILFIPTLSFEPFHSPFSSKRNSKIQNYVIQYLSELKSKTLVKPFSNFNETNFSEYHLLMNSNLDYLTESLPNIISKFGFDLVIIDYPSTPLYEVILSESEVILFEDPSIPYKKESRDSISERVHLVKNISQFCYKIEKYINGSLRKKSKSTSFVNDYVFNDNTFDFYQDFYKIIR